MLFAGRLVLRIVLPIWGFFAGFTFGAGLVAEMADERFLGTVIGWVLGLVFGVIFALLAYFFYALAVILMMLFLPRGLVSLWDLRPMAHAPPRDPRA